LAGVLVIALGLSLTLAKRTRLGRPAPRWILSGGLVIETAELINLYVQEQWAAYLFLIALPFLLGPLAAEIRSLAARKNGSP
jgi:hypothetical protein